jgi:hypothetical protein
MELTMAEAKEIIESRGLTIDSNRLNDQNPAIYWKGEWVGYISEFSVSLHQDLPSLGLTEQGELIPFSDGNADQRLSRRIDTLKDSPRRYEERLRQEKVDDIREYFEVRKKMIREIDRHIAILEAEYYSRHKEATCA